MITIDSSVAIAGFASWHERHAQARKILGQQPRLVAHAALEAYSVLTRLPPPHRAQADLVARFLRGRFPDGLLHLPEHQQQGLVDLLAKRQIVGGQVYDALIGLTAAAHDATLISFDQRAALLYEAVGARVDLSASPEPPRRQPGRLAGRVPDDFFEPLPADELDAWEAA